MTIVTRFAPSPTGFLHIGGARTALFNWLFARHQGGKFYLRIEDTDRERSTQSAITAIIDGLQWLNLNWDGEIIYQFAQAARHRMIAQEMIAKGAAYYCYCSPAEIEIMREKARTEGKPPRYDGRCRHLDPKDYDTAKRPVVRLRIPENGVQTIDDLVQGQVTVANAQLDDMILLRADGTPTYMLSVVVDDYDMGITHIIRGDDHLTNTFRQKIIFNVMDWPQPYFAHIPLIHGPDGAKLSKRHGALGVDAYRELGILPDALCNYLTRLGWSHGDDEIFSRDQATAWFATEQIGRSPARFDMTKLMNINSHYLRQTPNSALITLMASLSGQTYQADQQSRLIKGLDGLKQRAKLLPELVQNAQIYVQNAPINIDTEAKILLDETALNYIKLSVPVLENLINWQPDQIEQTLRQLCEQQDIKFGKLAQPLRIVLTGKTVSPNLFEVMDVLGHQETLARIYSVIS